MTLSREDHAQRDVQKVHCTETGMVRDLVLSPHEAFLNRKPYSRVQRETRREMRVQPVAQLVRLL